LFDCHGIGYFASDMDLMKRSVSVIGLFMCV